MQLSREALRTARCRPQDVDACVRPAQVWRLCLEMVALGDFNDAAYVRQLWDVHLKSRCAGLQQNPPPLFEGHRRGTPKYGPCRTWHSCGVFCVCSLALL